MVYFTNIIDYIISGAIVFAWLLVFSLYQQIKEDESNLDSRNNEISLPALPTSSAETETALPEHSMLLKVEDLT